MCARARVIELIKHYYVNRFCCIVSFTGELANFDWGFLPKYCLENAFPKHECRPTSSDVDCVASIVEHSASEERYDGLSKR